KTINASTINGTTFHGGDMISNSNNTAGYYPMTITPDGAYNSTYFDSKVALRASVQSGAILYDYRSMLPNDNGKYIYSNTLINGQGVTIESGHTDTKDSTFNAKRTG
ncbi:phage tail protein, partial [Lactiplantibacillus pentosus]